MRFRCATDCSAQAQRVVKSTFARSVMVHHCVCNALIYSFSRAFDARTLSARRSGTAVTIRAGYHVPVEEVGTSASSRRLADGWRRSLGSRGFCSFDTLQPRLVVVVYITKKKQLNLVVVWSELSAGCHVGYELVRLAKLLAPQLF
jgi:hypothetical protein